MHIYDLNISSYKLHEKLKGNMDLLTLTWVVIDVICILIFLSYKFKNNLPDIFRDVTTWGKTRAEDKKRDLPWLRKIFLVPKRWFIHFYLFGLIWNACFLFSFTQTCLHKTPSFQGVLKLVPIIKGSSDASGLDCFSVLLTLTLITVQMIRRLYESLCVSSHSGKMHVGHYGIGLVFYTLVNLTVVAEIPTPLHKNWCNSCTFSKISWLHLLAISLFTWASYHQYKCHIILGKLTTCTPNGNKVYKIPYGDWFEYVSSPHYLAEIIIYIALFLTMKGLSTRWLLVIFFVVSNLTLGAIATHVWYQEKFKSYPKVRTIIIPYVY